MLSNPFVKQSFQPSNIIATRSESGNESASGRESDRESEGSKTDTVER
jgi:hypothetical protein